MVPIALVSAGVILLIEMTAHLGLKGADGPMMKLVGVTLDTHQWQPWVVAVAALGAGAALARFVAVKIAAAWDQVRAVVPVVEPAT